MKRIELGGARDFLDLSLLGKRSGLLTVIQLGCVVHTFLRVEAEARNV